MLNPLQLKLAQRDYKRISGGNPMLVLTRRGEFQNKTAKSRRLDFSDSFGFHKFQNAYFDKYPDLPTLDGVRQAKCIYRWLPESEKLKYRSSFYKSRPSLSTGVDKRQQNHSEHEIEKNSDEHAQFTDNLNDAQDFAQVDSVNPYSEENDWGSNMETEEQPSQDRDLKNTLGFTNYFKMFCFYHPCLSKKTCLEIALLKYDTLGSAKKAKYESFGYDMKLAAVPRFETPKDDFSDYSKDF